MDVQVQDSVGDVLLASFPAVKPPISTPFQLYSHSTEQRLLVGETPSTEFVSSDSTSANGGCYYLVARRSRSSNTLKIHPNRLHPYLFPSPVVKRLKHFQPIASRTDGYSQARNELGATFGSKKGQAAIRARERNKVDASAMQGVVGVLMDSIDTGSQSLSSQDQLRDPDPIATTHIPSPNMEASVPSDAYPIHSLIPKPDWTSLHTREFIHASSIDDQITLLHAKHNPWITSRLNTEQHWSKSQVKIITYISILFSLYRFSTNHRNKEITRSSLQKFLSSVPPTIIDSILSRFLESSRTSPDIYQSTTHSSTLLLTTLLALVLHLDNFSTDIPSLAQALSLPEKNIQQLFKSLGCIIRTPTEKERRDLGLTTEDGVNKRAILRVPLVFPKARFKKRK